MSLMDCSIRSKPKADSIGEILQKIANYDRITWEDYAEAFFTQRRLMEKEIDCYLPLKGHRLLLKAIVLPEKTKGGIILTENSRDSITYDIGLVIGIGSEAYTDIERFPNGPRCKVGDWVDFAPMEKQSKNFNGHPCYIINDDRVNSPIPDTTAAVKELRPYTAVKA